MEQGPSQRALVAARRVTAKPKQHGKGVVTAREAGAPLNVAPHAVQRARTVLRKGVVEVVDAVESGDLKLVTALKIVAKPREEQADVLARVLAASKGKKRSQTEGVLTPKRVRRSGPMRNADERAESMVSSLEFHAKHLTEAVGQVADCRDWPKRVRAVRTSLTRIISAMEDR